MLHVVAHGDGSRQGQGSGRFTGTVAGCGKVTLTFHTRFRVAVNGDIVGTSGSIGDFARDLPQHLRGDRPERHAEHHGNEHLPLLTNDGVRRSAPPKNACPHVSRDCYHARLVGASAGMRRLGALAAFLIVVQVSPAGSARTATKSDIVRTYAGIQCTWHAPDEGQVVCSRSDRKGYAGALGPSFVSVFMSRLSTWSSTALSRFAPTDTGRSRTSACSIRSRIAAFVAPGRGSVAV
jgi:hypothetical protein